jgi:alpha-ketoglutarate-dependent taurine dioxygenase
MNVEKIDSRFNVDDVTVGAPSSAQLTDAKIDQFLEAFNRFGVVCLQLDSRAVPVENLLMLTPLLGRAAPHNLTNRYGVYELREREVSNDKYPGTSNVEHPLHTDGAFLERPEALVALQCVDAASEGGESVLAGGWSVVELIRENPDCAVILSNLQQADSISIERDSQAVTAPVLLKVGDAYWMRYRHDTYANISIKPNIQAAYSAMQNFLTDRKNIADFALRANQILIVDNYSVLHGRNAFVHGGKRLVNRMNYLGDGKLEGEMKYGIPIH